MKESVAIAKEADTKKDFSPTKSDNSIHRVRNEPERQLGSLRGVMDNIRHDGGRPSVENIATELSGMHIAQRAPALLALQQTHGNRYVQRVVAGIQAKLVVGQPGDVYEQEADRVAEEVMRMPELEMQRQVDEEEEETLQTKLLIDQITPLVQRQVEEEEEKEISQRWPEDAVEAEEDRENIPVSPKLMIGSPNDTYEKAADSVADAIMQISETGNHRVKPVASPVLQRQVLDDDDDESTIQRKANSKNPPSSMRDLSRIMRSPGSGSPLPAGVKNKVEPVLGADLGEARVHNDATANSAAKSIQAKAFTHKNNIFLGKGQSPYDLSLMAHEAAHVVQQRKNLAGSSVIQRRLMFRGSGVRSSSGFSGCPGGTVETEETEEYVAPIDQFMLDRFIDNIDRYFSGIINEDSSAEQRERWRNWIESTITAMQESEEEHIFESYTDLARGVFRFLIESLNENDDDLRERVLLLGAILNDVGRSLVQPHIVSLGPQWESQFNLTRFGISGTTPAFDPSPFSSLISDDPSASFTGVGATGDNPATLAIDFDALVTRILGRITRARGRGENVNAAFENTLSEIEREFRNPGYSSPSTSQRRALQAELMLRRNISSVASSSTANLPSRVQIIRAAATRHNLHPELIAAFLLAEQRDQSQNEDAADYFGAHPPETSSLIGRSIIDMLRQRFGGDTSIGLGQVVISTAMGHDLFADLLSEDTHRNLTERQVAELLASDEFNIFATARYIRILANEGSRLNIALPQTRAEFPNLDLSAYANHSSTWPDDNIRVLGMEYTSTPWDDSLIVLGWAHAVFESYQDVMASGVF